MAEDYNSTILIQEEGNNLSEEALESERKDKGTAENIIKSEVNREFYGSGDASFQVYVSQQHKGVPSTLGELIYDLSTSGSVSELSANIENSEGEVHLGTGTSIQVEKELDDLFERQITVSVDYTPFHERYSFDHLHVGDDPEAYADVRKGMINLENREIAKIERWAHNLN